MSDADTSLAATLGIGEGFVVWVVGDSVEESSLLDPLPEGAETVAEPDDQLDAAVLLVEDARALAAHLDDVLPHVQSTPVVWVCYPRRSLEAPAVAEQVAEYGWWPDEPVELDETWSGVRLRQD